MHAVLDVEPPAVRARVGSQRPSAATTVNRSDNESDDRVDAPALSVIIPAHNSASVLAHTLQQWRGRLEGRPAELIVVENGSSDATWDIAQDFGTDGFEYVAMQSEKGLGNALRAGIGRSRGSRILLTADDLPFGFDDLEEDSKLSQKSLITIGSKAHPASQIDRGLARRISTGGFKAMRRLLLGSHVGDSQGTIIADGEWLRLVAPKCTDSGFLFTTELIYVAELQHAEVVEVPVRLTEHQNAKQSSVRLSDVRRMGLGMLAMRRDRQRYRSAGVVV